MAYDQIIQVRDDGMDLKVVPIALSVDKKMYLLHIFEENHQFKKKYIRNELVLIGTHVLTSTFSDTVHFMEELSLFDIGNDQNKYLSISEYKSTKNLKLKYDGDENIFISKSEARAIYKIFNLAFKGYSVASLLEKEFRLTPEKLTQLLHKSNLFEK